MILAIGFTRCLYFCVLSVLIGPENLKIDSLTLIRFVKINKVDRWNKALTLNHDEWFLC